MGMTRIRKWTDGDLTLEKLTQVIQNALHYKEEWAFLDSSLNGRDGRYSILGLYPYLQAEESQGVLLVNGQRREGDLLDFLKCYLTRHYAEEKTVTRDSSSISDEFTGSSRKSAGSVETYGDDAATLPPDFPMTDGAIGYLSYDYGRARMGIPSRHSASVHDLPEGRFVFYDLYLVEDLQEKTVWVCTQERREDLSDYLRRIHQWMTENSASDEGNYHSRSSGIIFSSDYREKEYEQTIDRLIEYMKAGDIYVMNMTRRITAQHIGDPYRIFRYLREHNPSPFGAFLSGSDGQIVCASPERFLRVRGGVVETSPIKGTRKRGATPEEDLRLRQELEHSEKDKSELLMIVDLERNDLNRVCVPGSVQVPRMYYIESFATVHHLISDVTGRLKRGYTALDLLQAAFPGGSITGAPKYRAMEIIDEQEHSARGLYTGTIGYLGTNGDCDFNIVIRTAVCQDGRCTIGAGGGITVDSDPAFEFEETNQKAAALIDAICQESGAAERILRR
ncbi:MAG: aminodeoxychorismate synthase component I [Bilifractor sp.]